MPAPTLWREPRLEPSRDGRVNLIAPFSPPMRGLIVAQPVSFVSSQSPVLIINRSADILSFCCHEPLLIAQGQSVSEVRKVAFTSPSRSNFFGFGFISHLLITISVQARSPCVNPAKPLARLEPARVANGRKPDSAELKHLICLRMNIIILLTRRRRDVVYLYPWSRHIRLNLSLPNRRA